MCVLACACPFVCVVCVSGCVRVRVRVSVCMCVLVCREGAGVVVDGFPRTMVQAQVIKLLHDKMNLVRAEYKDHPDFRDRFRRPIFRIAVLYVEEEESVKRQLARGDAVAALFPCGRCCW